MALMGKSFKQRLSGVLPLVSLRLKVPSCRLGRSLTGGDPSYLRAYNSIEALRLAGRQIRPGDIRICGFEDTAEVCPGCSCQTIGTLQMVKCSDLRVPAHRDSVRSNVDLEHRRRRGRGDGDIGKQS